MLKYFVFVKILIKAI